MQVNCVLWALRLKLRTLCLRIGQMLAQWIMHLRQWVIGWHQQCVLVPKRTVTTQMEKVNTKKPAAPLLDAKTITGLFVHVARESPCVNGVTVTIIHSCAAWYKTHLNRLEANSKAHVLGCCISACRGIILVSTLQHFSMKVLLSFWHF